MVVDALEGSARALHVSPEERVPLYRCEEEIIGCINAHVGAELMRRWNFPPALTESTGGQNNPAAAQDYALETATAYIAVCLKTLDIPAGDQALEPDCVAPLAWQRTGPVAADMKSVLRTAARTGQLNTDYPFSPFSRSA